MFRKIIVLAAAFLAIPQSASAASFAVYDFTQTDVAGFGSGPFGSVKVTDNGATLDVLVTLAAGFVFRQPPDGSHTSFAFSILGDPAVSITNLSSGFESVALPAGDSVTAQPFGYFFTGINCTDCTAGYNGGVSPKSLSFTIGTAGPLDFSSLGFGTKGDNISFAADLANSAGKTGSVGAVFTTIGRDAPPPVPEPATWAMMLVGFGAIGAAMRRRSQPVRLRYT